MTEPAIAEPLIEYEPLTTVEEVQRLLEWDMDEDEARVCVGAIEDASALVRAEGLEWPVRATAPQIARVYTRNAVLRYLRNPEGYLRDKTEFRDWSRPDQGQGGHVYLTDAEVERLNRIAESAKFTGGILQTYVWSNAPASDLKDITRPVAGWPNARPIPYYDGRRPYL